MDKAVILASGGINSTVAAAVAAQQYEPALLHVAWGHRAASRELYAFEEVVTAMEFERACVAELGCMATFSGNSRVCKRLVIEEATGLHKGTPGTFALGLMPAMLSLASAWAGAIGAKRIIVGISEDHGVPGPAVSELYPDHRIEFLQTFNLMLTYAKPPERELIVEAPLIELTREEVIRLGHRLKVPFGKTWSCYEGGKTPCGKCRPCATRTTGFLRAKVPDPLLLEPASVG
jgi:7-cyano-7-deazaguanine synthase